jgi:hypothetical protein
MGDAITLVPGSSLPVTYVLGSYAGSWVGGAAVGYVVAKKGAGAVTGGLTTSGLWAFGEGIRGFRSSSGLVTAAFFGLSGLSLWLAWRRR